MTKTNRETKRRKGQSASKAELADLLDKASPVIVGLWRFRRANEKTPQWCTTWRHNGNYYDTYPKASPALALKAMLRNVKEVRARARR